MSQLQDIALKSFFDFYRRDIESEVIDESNVVLSFPVHFSGFHRIEVTVTKTAADLFIISDGAKVIDELRMAGYKITKGLRERVESIAKTAKLRIVNSHLVTDCDLAGLGVTLQRFVEAVKTIGDAYLVQRMSVPRDKQIFLQITEFLLSQQVPFKSRYPLKGDFELHVTDFFFPPNGVPGLALSVVNNPTKTVADAWAYRALDIKKNNDRVQVGVVYDDKEISGNSASVLAGMMDVSLPSSKIGHLSGSLQRLGIIHES